MCYANEDLQESYHAKNTVNSQLDRFFYLAKNFKIYIPTYTSGFYCVF